MRSRARLYASSRSSLVSLPNFHVSTYDGKEGIQNLTYCSLTAFSFESLPTSEVGLDGAALADALSPSSPRRMILRGNTTGAGELLVVDGTAILDKEGGIRQKGVL